MPVVAIDRTKGSCKVLTCSNELAAALQAWREAQRPIEMSESQAIAALLWKPLLDWREQQSEREDRRL
jgi:hypothetical protein